MRLRRALEMKTRPQSRLWRMRMSLVRRLMRLEVNYCPKTGNRRRLRIARFICQSAYRDVGAIKRRERKDNDDS